MKSYKILCIIAILAIGLFLSVPATAYQLYGEDFESGTAPGFTLNSFWHATGNAPYAGSFALGFVHDETPGSVPNGSYAGTGGSEQFAFGPKITLPNSSNITFSFAARVDDEIGDAPDYYDRLSIGVSLDGTSFNTVLASSNPQNGGVNIPENVGYNLFTTDLSAFAGQDIYLAFSFTTFDNVDDAHPGPRIDNLQITAASTGVPEPATMLLLGLGLMGLAGARRKIKK